MKARVLISIGIFALFVVLISQNSGPVTIKFLFLEEQVSLTVILGAALGLGVLAGVLFTGVIERMWKKDKTRPPKTDGAKSAS